MSEEDKQWPTPVSSARLDNLGISIDAVRERIAELQPDPVPAFGSLTASRDAATVQQVIQEKYGFVPPLHYCSELIDFIEALTDGQKNFYASR